MAVLLPPMAPPPHNAAFFLLSCLSSAWRPLLLLPSPPPAAAADLTPRRRSWMHARYSAPLTRGFSTSSANLTACFFFLCSIPSDQTQSSACQPDFYSRAPSLLHTGASRRRSPSSNVFFGNLASGGHAYVVGSAELPNQNWHIYYASQKPELPPMVTLEMCTTGLDGCRASLFFKESPDGFTSSAKDMTKRTGIPTIIPDMEICDFEFDPCGYSMNGISGAALSTIHVTPEDGFNYASYKAMGFDPSSLQCRPLIDQVLRCFGPSDFSVAVTVFGGREWASSWGKEELDVHGYSRRYLVEQELPCGGLLLYQSFSAKAMPFWASLPCCEGERENRGERWGREEIEGMRRFQSRTELVLCNTSWV